MKTLHILIFEDMKYFYIDVEIRKIMEMKLKGINTPSVSVNASVAACIGIYCILWRLGIGLGPIFKRHHRPALAAWRWRWVCSQLK